MSTIFFVTTQPLPRFHDTFTLLCVYLYKKPLGGDVLPPWGLKYPKIFL